MIYGRLSDFENLGLVALGETVMQSVAWIRSLPANPMEGWHSVGANDLNALVLSYQTGAADELRFETHRKFVDLQYTIAGYEIINWAPRDSLSNNGAYDAIKDVQFHHPDAMFGSFIKAPGFFSIHTPADAHRPGVQLVGPDRVFKLVVKIPVTLFSPASRPGLSGCEVQRTAQGSSV